MNPSNGRTKSIFSHVVNCCVAYATPIPARRVLDEHGRVIERLAPVSIQWHRARHGLAPPTNYGALEMVLDGMEVGEARSLAAKMIFDRDPVPEFLFFLDYDVIPEHDALRKLVYRARCYPNHEILAGVYCLKDASVSEPLIYDCYGSGPYWDWTVGDILHGERIKAVHMGLTLVRSSLLGRMFEKLGRDAMLFETKSHYGKTDGLLTRHTGTEDLHFCKMAVEEFGAQILIDTGVLAGHQDQTTGVIYGLPSDSPPVKRAHWMRLRNGQGTHGEKEQPLKRALDLGAGSFKRTWPEHETISTDIRTDAGADLVQDSRQLTLHNDSFDLVASSHHLEHIARFEQEQVWSEIYRVCKPGGRIEHIVPSLEWAAAQIVAEHVDEDVYNVLYGAQETHGYARELNTHFFGYTKEIAKQLAESVGFVEIQCFDWRDDERNDYNLIITGKKPCLENTNGASGTTTNQQSQVPTANHREHELGESSASCSTSGELEKSCKGTTSTGSVTETNSGGDATSLECSTP